MEACESKCGKVNKSHTLAYSIIGLQELNLCYKYNPIYWNCANLIVDSGALDEEANDATNYGKMAVAIASVQHEGVNVALPGVNDADFGFTPDTKNDSIVFGLKGINGINTEVSQAIISNRPYDSIEDFMHKLYDTKIIGNAQMVKLIKGGCFTELHNSDRTDTMKWFLQNYVFKPCESLTLLQFDNLQKMNIIPDNVSLAVKMYNFKKYVLDDNALYEKYIDSNKKVPKRGYHDGHYLLDNNSMPFFKNHFTEDSVIGVKGEYYILSEKKFIKEVDSYIQPLKDWCSAPNSLREYNEVLFNQIWEKHASGNVANWNMSALCYYDNEHELQNVNNQLYGIVNFFNLPEEPEPYDYYTRYIDGNPKACPKYKIYRIAGTILNNDNNHHTVSLLTIYGVVNVKLNKGHYAFYNKQISARLDEDSDKKTVLEKSWLSRGNKITVCGIRRGDQFIPMIYNDTIYKHTINLIQEVYDDGTLLLQSERIKV